MRKLRILIVDEFEVVRKGVRAIMDAHPEWEICGEAATVAEAIRKTEHLKPDMVVLELALKEMDGFEIIDSICRKSPRSEVLILTRHDSGEVAIRALAAGAKGIVLKSESSRYLISAVKAVSQHKRFLSPRVGEIVANSLAHRNEARPRLEVLTVRQKEILKALAEGKSTKEVATNLGISPKTADVHRAQIMQKLRLRSQSDLIFFAIRAGIVKL